MIHRISGAIVHVPEKTLMIEKPSRDFGHVARTSIEEKDIISESWMLFWSQLFKRLPLVKKSAIESHQLMEKFWKTIISSLITCIMCAILMLNVGL